MLISDYFPLYAAENASMNSTGHEDSIDRREVKMKLWHLSNNLKILTPRFAEVPWYYQTKIEIERKVCQQEKILQFCRQETGYFPISFK